MKSIEERLVKVEVEEPVIVPNADGTTRTVMVKVPALRDPDDGEIYLGADAIAILDKAKARHMGVLAPQELAELRQRLGLTQKEIAEVLQIGEKTWSRWETGREIVSRSLNVLLRAVYEGKISLPWLRALFSRTEFSILLPPPVRNYGVHWEIKGAHVMVFSTGAWLGEDQSHAAESQMSMWSRLRVHTQNVGIRHAKACGADVGGRGQRDFAQLAGRTEEMPLGA